MFIFKDIDNNMAITLIRNTLCFTMGTLVGVLAKHVDSFPLFNWNHVAIVSISSLAFFATQLLFTKSK